MFDLSVHLLYVSYLEYQLYKDAAIAEGSTDAGNSPVTENLSWKYNSHFKISQPDSGVYTHQWHWPSDARCRWQQLSTARSRKGFTGNKQ